MSSNLHSLVVIDDDELMLEMIERRLRGFECCCRYFSDELLGLAYLKENKPDTLIVDQRMPRMNGVELLAELGDSLPGQVYVMSSAPLPSAEEVAARGLGAVSVSKDLVVEKNEVATLLGLL